MTIAERQAKLEKSHMYFDTLVLLYGPKWADDLCEHCIETIVHGSDLAALTVALASVGRDYLLLKQVLDEQGGTNDSVPN
jgi:hypothetical protein